MEVNAVQITQVLVNLILNAIQAMPDGGEMHMEMAAARRQDYARVKLPPGMGEDLVVLTIRDTGEGIPPENLGKIFDPFFTTKAVGQGSGLGLSVSHGIITRHGGTILAESKPGQGATMTVILPAHPGEIS